MNQFNFIHGIALLGALLWVGCKAPALEQLPAKVAVPNTYYPMADTAEAPLIDWHRFFNDPLLTNLIDTALLHNNELLITLQEIEIAKNEVQVRQGTPKPIVGLGSGLSIDKVGRYTSQGAGDASTEIKPGQEVPEWMPDLVGGAYARWEVDIWKKLRNARQAAVERYLASREGKNFVITNLIAEIADRYFELMALDNQLDLLQQTIKLQSDALAVVKLQKEAARTTELAVQKFEAEVLTAKSKQFEILKQIRAIENEINFLCGRFPQAIRRNRQFYQHPMLASVHAGFPSQLLQNRPDIRQAEINLRASALDVAVARAEFLPNFEISSKIGLNAFNPRYLVSLPQSLIASLVGEVAAPLINKNAIQAEFKTANARQLQALYEYDQSVINAFSEVSTELSNLENLEQGFELKSQAVAALAKSTRIANELYQYARADYLEVLLTQRDALESNLELSETQLQKLQSTVALYRKLGGGWQ